jgi:PTH2 family peptidyl-tRNA hydrolase
MAEEPTARPKQVIIMRADLNMRKGKMIAQGSHAVMKVLLDLVVWSESSQATLPLLPAPMVAWMKGAFTKICVRAKSEAQLVELYEKAKAAGLPCALIEDHGHTEFHGVVTKTCCAIGPAMPEDLDPITGNLELL